MVSQILINAKQLKTNYQVKKYQQYPSIGIGYNILKNRHFKLRVKACKGANGKSMKRNGGMEESQGLGIASTAEEDGKGAANTSQANVSTYDRRGKKGIKGHKITRLWLGLDDVVFASLSLSLFLFYYHVMSHHFLA